jgi:signal peptidase I
LTAIIKKLWKNDYFQTVVVVVLIVAVVFGFWFGSQLVLNTKIPPALAVVSGSMCIPYDGACDGWTHPFDRTLHVGDIIVIQGVDPKDLNTNYPNSDIIVFHRPDNPNELIVHRIISVTERNGTLYFLTKGDGNSPSVWPNPAGPYHDPWGEVKEDLVVGKVIMRIPWVGHIAIFMHDVLGVNNSLIGIPIIIILIIILVIIEFVLPILRGKRTPREPKTTAN